MFAVAVPREQWPKGKVPLRTCAAWHESGVRCTEVLNKAFTHGRRTCRVCGCTDDRACPGGCWWVEEDLCSSCAGATEATP